MTLQLTYAITAEQTTIEVTGDVPYAGRFGIFQAGASHRITTLAIDDERLQLQDVPLVGPWRVRRGAVGPATGAGAFPEGPRRYQMTTPAAHDAGAEVRFIPGRATTGG